MFLNIRRSMNRLNQVSKYFFSRTPQFVHSLTPDYLLDESQKPRKRTKTVCTIGPKTQASENAGKLIDEGLSVARLNFSHGDHQEHRIQMVGVQQALKSRPHSHASILLDTKGPQIRTGNNEEGKSIEVKRGQLLQITTDYKHLCNSKRISCSYPDLPTSTSPGKKILIADGGISTVVKKIEGNIVTVEVLNDGKFGSRKNMALPGCIVNLPTITESDKVDIIDFGVKHKVNYIAVSFARHKKDLDELRRLIIEADPQHGPYIQLISKIENHEAIHNLGEIIEGSDGIMVARGDLGMEVPIQKVVILQKYISERTINAGKTVVTATQMLESMETKPRPTRAEVSDITNSVFDLTDGNMTSGETTNGQFPTECARFLRLIAQEAESTCDYKRLFEYRKPYIKGFKDVVGAVALSFEIGSDFIFIQTDDVKLITRISSLRPHAYVIVFTNDARVKGAVGINFGVYCYPTSQNTTGGQFLLKHGKNYGFSKTDKATILDLHLQNGKIVGSRTMQIN